MAIVFKYEFRRCVNAAQEACNINDVYGLGTASGYWFDRFRYENYNLNNVPSGWQETKVDDDELKAIVEADLSQTKSELAVTFNVSDETILIRLRQIGKIKKLGKWVPNKLIEQQQQNREESWLNLQNKWIKSSERNLNRIITCDEKWIL